MQDVDPAEFERYLRIYQENPDSRVFAPLADLYRRQGKLEEAARICREGIRRHPYYAGGRVALAHVLLDAQSFKEAFKEAESVVTYYPDNLLARKLLIRCLGALGQGQRAQRELEALRFMAPVVAEDPELLKATQAHRNEVASSHHEVPESPEAFLPHQSDTPPTESLEKTEFMPLATLPPSRAQGSQEYYIPSRKERLLRQQSILQSLIQSLGSQQSLS